MNLQISNRNDVIRELKNQNMDLRVKKMEEVKQLLNADQQKKYTNLINKINSK